MYYDVQDSPQITIPDTLLLLCALHRSADRPQKTFAGCCAEHCEHHPTGWHGQLWEARSTVYRKVGLYQLESTKALFFSSAFLWFFGFSGEAPPREEFRSTMAIWQYGNTAVYCIIGNTGMAILPSMKVPLIVYIYTNGDVDTSINGKQASHVL